MIKSFLSNPYVTLAFRLLLGLTFLFACIDKMSDPTGFAKAIANYKLVSGSITTLVATVLPWIEFLCALAVLSGFYARGGSMLIFLMLCAFTLAVLTGLIRGLDISCGCFTLDPGVHRIGWQKVLENIGLILVSLAVMFSRSDKFTMDMISSQSLRSTE